MVDNSDYNEIVHVYPDDTHSFDPFYTLNELTNKLIKHTFWKISSSSTSKGMPPTKIDAVELARYTLNNPSVKSIFSIHSGSPLFLNKNRLTNLFYQLNDTNPGVLKLTSHNLLPYIYQGDNETRRIAYKLKFSKVTVMSLYEPTPRYSSSLPFIDIFNFDKLTDTIIGVGFDGSLSKRTFSLSPSFETNPLINLLISDATPKLYVVVAPTGFGKSTLIDEMRYLCVKPMPKVTTRPNRNLAELRDDSIEFVSRDTFTEGVKEDFIVGGHAYNSHLYGLKRDKIKCIPSTHRNYIVDSCDVESALRLRQEFPDLVRLVTLFPSVTYSGFGLEERLKDLSKPSSGFDSFQEELDYLKRNKIAKTDTKARLEYVVSESIKFEKYLPHFDIVLKGYDLQSNVNQLLLEMAK